MKAAKTKTNGGTPPTPESELEELADKVDLLKGGFKTLAKLVNANYQLISKVDRKVDYIVGTIKRVRDAFLITAVREPDDES